MGININDIDTVCFYKPWESKNRMCQLIGRGSRLHPSKYDVTDDKHYFKILNFTGGTDEEIQKGLDSLMSILFEKLRCDVSDVIENTEIFDQRGQCNQHNERIDSKFIEIRIYDSKGNLIDEHKQTILRLKIHQELIRKHLKIKTIKGYYELMKEKPELGLPEDAKQLYSSYFPINFYDYYLSRNIDAYPLNFDELKKKINLKIKLFPRQLKHIKIKNRYNTLREYVDDIPLNYKEWFGMEWVQN
jgi:hypothetical protein